MAGQEIMLSSLKVIDLAYKYRYDSPESFTKVEKVHNNIIGDERNQDIPNFWERSDKEGVFQVLRQHAASKDVYSACGPVSKTSEYFDYVIAMVYDGSPVPEGYRVWDVEPTLWAVFPCIGKDGACIGETWDKIFKEFLPNSDYNMMDAVDFEEYPAESVGDLFCEVWVPVEKRV